MDRPQADSIRETGVAGLLSATYHFMMSKIMDRLSVEGYQNISKTQLHVLARFDAEGMTLAQISQRVQISVQVVSNIVNMLVTGGYVAEIEEGTAIGDYRYALTQRGKQVLTIVSSEQHEVEKTWEQELGHEEFTSVISGLEKLFAATIRAQKRAKS